MSNTREIVAKGHDVELAEQVGEDEYACTLCGSRNVDWEQYPSMAPGFADDIVEHCPDCHATATTSTFDGVTTIRRPAPQPSPAGSGAGLECEHTADALDDEPSAATDHEIADAIRIALIGAQITDDDELYAESAPTFADAGVLTYNAGFVLRLNDGSEYQITVVKSRDAEQW